MRDGPWTRPVWMVIFFLISCGIGGCASANLGYTDARVWAYSPRPRAEPADPRGPALTVLPFEDRRPTENRNHLPLALIPGIFYADMDYSRPEAPIPHLLSGREWTFDPPEDFRKAASDELAASEIFKSVHRGTSPDTDGLVLRGAVIETRYIGRVFTYFASAGGPLVGWWFLPEGMVAGSVTVEFRLEDPQSGAVIWARTYEEKDEGDLFWIWEKTTDFRFPEFYRRIMERAVPEIRATVAARMKTHAS